MPLRKQGTIIPALIALTLAGGALPATAAAWGTWGSPTPTPTPTPIVDLSAQFPVATGVGCTALPVKQAFSRYSDAANYYVAPGGSFELNTPKWTLGNGARITSGNENLGIQAGSKALELPLGGVATSPQFCVDETNPTFRFTSKLSSLDGGYAAIVIYRDSAGTVTDRQFTSSRDGSSYNGATSWNPSASNPLATNIPLVTGGATASVQLKFIGTTTSYGRWVGSKAYIDSVMVDPSRRG